MTRRKQVLTLFISLFLLCGSALAQDHLLPIDSLLLPVVNIQHHKNMGIEEAVASDLSGAASMDLGQFLDRMGLATILSNGAPGASSSIRNRGLASDHTVLNWNGVPINSVSLGTCDLSLVPVFFVDKAEVISNHPFQGSVNANLGDVVQLKSISKEIEGFYVDYHTSINTLNNSFTGIDVGIPLWNNKNTHDASVFSRTRFFYQDIKNDFEYRDQFLFEQPLVDQQHNNGVNQGFQQELRWQRIKSDLHVHVWWQEKKYQLPAIMGSLADGSAEQRDEVARTLLTYKYYLKNAKISTSHAWIEEHLNYRDKRNNEGIWLLDSRIQSQVWYSDFLLDWKLSKTLNWNSSINIFIPKVKNTNYENGAAQLSYAQLNSGIHWNKRNHMVKLDGRYDSRASVYKPNLVMEYQYHLSRGKHNWSGLFNGARLFRFPDLNELYWVPGGNRDLAPEDAWSFQSALNWKWNFANFWCVQLGVKSFKKRVENWIQWIPGNNGFWSPVNYKQVRITGFDIPLSVEFISNKNKFGLDFMWRKTEAKFVNQNKWDLSQVKSLVYTPANSLHGGLSGRFGALHFVLRYNYYSERYTDESNTAYRMLDSYQLCYAEVGYLFSWPKAEIKSSLSIDNLFDVSYQSVRSYAMPGRVYQLNFQFNLHK